jgi:hypothetical protein
VKLRVGRDTIRSWLLPLSALAVLVWLAVGILNLVVTLGPLWLSIPAFVLAAWALWDTRYWWDKRSETREEQQEE